MGLFDGLQPHAVPPMALGRRNPGHKIMLEDTARVEPYRQALQQLVKPGMRVLDLGTGTGLLGLLALKAGAGKLYAIEASNTIQIARRVAADSALADKAVFLKGLSSRVSLPERVDLLVAEILADFCYEEQILDITADARDRFLEPGGILMPSAVRAFLVPMTHPDFYEQEISFWDRPVHGLDYRSLREMTVHTEYSFSIGSEGFLSEPRRAFSHDLGTVRESQVSCELSFPVGRSGLLHGLGGWFEADLAPGIVLSTAPHLPETTWRQVFFPVSRPMPLEEGDEVSVGMRGSVREQGFCWTWRVAHHRQGLCLDTQDHSTFHGMGGFAPPSEEQFTPSFPQDKRLSVFILAQCDGRRSLAEAAERTMAEFPGAFPDRSRALERVLQVIREYSSPT